MHGKIGVLPLLLSVFLEQELTLSLHTAAVFPVKKHRTHQPKQTAVTNVAIIEALEATNNC